MKKIDVKICKEENSDETPNSVVISGESQEVTEVEKSKTYSKKTKK